MLQHHWQSLYLEINDQWKSRIKTKLKKVLSLGQKDKTTDAYLQQLN